MIYGHNTLKRTCSAYRTASSYEIEFRSAFISLIGRHRRAGVYDPSRIRYKNNPLFYLVVHKLIIFSLARSNPIQVVKGCRVTSKKARFIYGVKKERYISLKKKIAVVLKNN